MRDKFQLILASASPRRAQLMRQAGLDFRVLPSTVREKHSRKKNPKALAMDLALQKARDVARGLEGRQGKQEVWVLGADTLVWLDGSPLGKPKGPKDAARMLAKLSGRTHQVVTGLALVRVGGEGKPREIKNAEATRVTFRALSREEIRDYIASGEGLDKAGAYGIQGLAGGFVKKVNGCYFNVVGLPLAKLSEMLASLPPAPSRKAAP